MPGCQEKKEEKVINPENNTIQAYTVDNITFDNISISYEKNQTSISMIIHNNQEEAINLGSFKVNALNQNNELIKTFDAYYDLDIAPQDEGELTISVDQELKNVQNITIDLNGVEN